MTGDLRERLADLAGDAPRPTPGPTDDLWQRGRRRLWRERAATGLAVLVVMAGLGSLVGLVVGRDAPQPVAPRAQPGLPDRFYMPSPWLPGTAGHPIGPLAAVFEASRSTWSGATTSSRSAYVGVSATTGAYRFLDLQDMADDEAHLPAVVSLSPDGRRVGYWLAGRVRDSDGRSGSGVVGFAVYDTVTGRVARHPVTSPLGLAPVGTAWSRDRVWFQWDRVLEAHTDSQVQGDRTTVTLSVTGDDQQTVTTPVDDLRFTSSDGRRVLVTNTRRLQVLTDPDETGRRLRLVATRRTGPAYLSPDGRRVAAVVDPDTCCPDQDVLVGRVGAASRLTLRHPVGVRAGAVLGWRDEHSLVVVRGTGAIDTVDVDTGSTASLSHLPADYQNFAQGIALAADVLAGPVVPGVRPPRATDPRARLLLTGLAGLGGLGVLVGVGLWTRRRRGRA